MGDWERVCTELSSIFDDNAELNFNIRLTPQEVSEYLIDKLLFSRISINANTIEAALFVSIDGECGFIAKGIKTSGVKFLIKEFENFVVGLPQDLRTKLWCRVQKDNHKVKRLAQRLGFVEDSVTDTAIYYLLKGG